MRSFDAHLSCRGKVLLADVSDVLVLCPEDVPPLTGQMRLTKGREGRVTLRVVRIELEGDASEASTS
eukprot:3429068-Pleurochrysis_carterae.AAC.2